MTIEQTNVVNCSSIDPESGEVWLTISDHLDWGPGRDEELEHLWALQEKINAYLGYMESGEIYEKYPPAKGRKLVINVVGKFLPHIYEATNSQTSNANSRKRH